MIRYYLLCKIRTELTRKNKVRETANPCALNWISPLFETSREKKVGSNETLKTHLATQHLLRVFHNSACNSSSTCTTAVLKRGVPCWRRTRRERGSCLTISLSLSSTSKWKVCRANLAVLRPLAERTIEPDRALIDDRTAIDGIWLAAGSFDRRSKFGYVRLFLSATDH